MTRSSRPHRRALIKGAAWTAPAIVLATAAPATAASGAADVITTIPPTMDTYNGPGEDGTLPVLINFTNTNTGSTGSVSITVTFLGVIAGVTADRPTDVSPGWSFVSPAEGNQFNRRFTFMNPVGIAGAGTPTGTAESSLAFTIRTVTATTTSNGAITTTATAASGQIRPGSGSWA